MIHGARARLLGGLASAMFASLVWASGCVGTIGPGPGPGVDSGVKPPPAPTDSGVVPPPPTRYEPAHLQPKSWSTLKLSYETWKLSDLLKGDDTLSIALVGNVLWFGGKKGLFRRIDGKFVRVSETPVMALSAWDEAGKKSLVIAKGKQLFLWDKGMVESSLNGKLGDSPIEALFLRASQELWIGTQAALWQLKGTELRKFESIKGARSIRGFQASSHLVIEEHSGEIKVLREDKDGWSIQSPSAEGKVFEQVLPMSNGEFWGLVGGDLFLRKLKDASASWWPYVLQQGLKADDSGKVPAVDPKWKVRSLVLDPSGMSWAITQEFLVKLDGSAAQQMAIPKELETLSLTRMTRDGSLWLSDGANLVRVTQKTRAIAYKEDVEPFVSKSCVRCHSSGGSGAHFLLTSLDEVKAGVNKMIKRIEDGSMPPPPAQLLGGDAELLRQWIKGGYKP